MDDHGWKGTRAILIAGPTASGKSAVALRLAERLGGVVINADSMQVYADLPILTARPEAAEIARAPHRLFGHVDAATDYSVGRWLDDVAGTLREARAERQVPIIVGGTGLYLKALTQGISAIPAVPEAVRARLRAEATGLRPEVLHARLAALDPAMALRLRPSDPQRVLRALEVFATTGRSLLTFQGERSAPLLAADDWIGAMLAPERPVLNVRIDLRFDRMIEQGALDEVARLATRGLDTTRPAMRALGVPPLLAALRGTTTVEAAVADGKRATRLYAKRQITFARHQLPGLDWVTPDEAETTVLARW